MVYIIDTENEEPSKRGREPGTEAVMKQTRSYYPNQIQLRIVEVADRNNIKVQVYERVGQNGAFAGTKACSNAVISTAYDLGLIDRKVTVQTGQGELEIELREDGSVLLAGESSRNASVVLTRR